MKESFVVELMACAQDDEKIDATEKKRQKREVMR